MIFRNKYARSISANLAKKNPLNGILHDKNVNLYLTLKAESLQLRSLDLPEIPLQERVIVYFLYYYDLGSLYQNKTGDIGFIILLKSDKE